MNEKQFWELIQKTKDRAKSKDEQYDLLAVELSNKPVDNIQDFYNLCFEFMDEAYSWDLWGAANIITGHCPDESFADFRFWLVSEGKEAYDKALKDPDSLADYPAQGLDEFDDVYSSKIIDIAIEVYKKKTGEELLLTAERKGPRDPLGKIFNSEDHEALEKRYPRLYKKYFG